MKYFQLLILLTSFVANSAQAGLTILDPYYKSSIFASGGFSDALVVNHAGDLFVRGSFDPDNYIGGIYKYSPDGSVSTWSEAKGFGVAISESGIIYTAQRSAGSDGITKVETDGSYSSLPLSFNTPYTHLAAGNGKLYANIWAGSGAGIYEIDPISGAGSLIVSAGGWEWYGAMKFGSDGELYVSHFLNGSSYLSKLENGGLVNVLTTPEFFFEFTFDDRGNLFTTHPRTDGVVYKINLATGQSTLFATNTEYIHGIAFDPLTSRLYLAGQGESNIYAVTVVPEPSIYALIFLGIMILLSRRNIKV